VHNEGNVSNEQVSQPNASRPSNVTWPPSQHSELIDIVRAYFAKNFYIFLY
jgi:hypothetical protein